MSFRILRVLRLGPVAGRQHHNVRLGVLLPQVFHEFFSAFKRNALLFVAVNSILRVGGDSDSPRSRGDTTDVLPVVDYATGVSERECNGETSRGVFFRLQVITFVCS